KAGLEAERREFEVTRQRELAQFRDQQKIEIARTERRLEEIAKEMSDRAAQELQSVQDEAVRKKFQRKLDAVKAHASAEVRAEKSKAYDAPKVSAPPKQLTTGAPVSVEVGATVRIRSLGVTGSIVTLAS